MTEAERVFPDGGLAFRIRRRPAADAPPILMLHGVGGDEDVMWVFESALPAGSHAVAPRALFPAKEGGWSWTRTAAEGLPSFADFEPALQAVDNPLARLRASTGVGESAWVWMGFSQGAGLAFAGAARSEWPIACVVSLAGFLPEELGADHLSRLQRVPVYWGHGTQDDQVPIERARRDVARLREAGVDVTYCEAEVGHKLGADCLRGLKGWLGRGSPDSKS